MSTMNPDLSHMTQFKPNQQELLQFIKKLIITKDETYGIYTYVTKQAPLFDDEWYSDAIMDHYSEHPADKNLCHETCENCKDTSYGKSFEQFSQRMADRMELATVLLLLNKASYSAFNKTALKKEIVSWSKNHPSFFNTLTQALEKHAQPKYKTLHDSAFNFICKIWVDLAEKNKKSIQNINLDFLDKFVLNDGKSGFFYRAKAFSLFAPEQVHEKLNEVYKQASEYGAVEAMNICESYYELHNLSFKEKSLNLFEEEVKSLIHYELVINTAALQKNLNLKKNEIKPVIEFINRCITEGTPGYYRKKTEYEKDYEEKDIPAKLKILFETYYYNGAEKEVEEMKKKIHEMMEIFQNHFLNNARKELIKKTELYTNDMNDMVSFFLEYCKKQKLYEKVNNSVEAKLGITTANYPEQPEEKSSFKI